MNSVSNNSASVSVTLSDQHNSNAIDPDPVFLTTAETVPHSGVGRTTMLQMVKDGTFPMPIKIGRSTRWVLSEVIAWKQEQIAKSRGGVK